MQSRTSTVRTVTTKTSVADRFLDQRERAAMAIDLAQANVQVDHYQTQLVTANTRLTVDNDREQVISSLHEDLLENEDGRTQLQARIDEQTRAHNEEAANHRRTE